MSIIQRLTHKLTGSPENPPPQTLELGRVVADASRCVQCGVCGYNCPVGIPVRDYARQGLPVDDPACIACGNCVAVCPRGTLRWETSSHAIVAARFAQQMGSQPTETPRLAQSGRLDQS